MVRFGAGGLDITVNTLKNMSGNKEFRSDSPLPTHEDVIKQVHRIGYGQPHPVPVSVTDLSFTYPDGTDPVLQNITIDIPAGTSLALCGLSGSGKTTLIDILLGLIPYRHGVITFDGVDIQNNMRSWHDHVAYVPQDVYILDSSIDANIAFGIPEDAWDRQRIVECIKAAQLTDVASEFESGRLASVGERGAKLSGGPLPEPVGAGPRRSDVGTRQRDGGRHQQHDPLPAGRGHHRAGGTSTVHRPRRRPARLPRERAHRRSGNLLRGPEVVEILHAAGRIGLPRS